MDEKKGEKKIDFHPFFSIFFYQKKITPSLNQIALFLHYF